MSESSADRGKTHWVGCYRDPKHFACAMAEIDRLEKLIEDLTDRIADMDEYGRSNL